jgi:hypothetical protein
MARWHGRLGVPARMAGGRGCGGRDLERSVLQWCFEHDVGVGVPRVCVASSLGVYQGVPDTPYREDARLRQLPVDPIPAVKNAVEFLAAAVAQVPGPQVVNLRIATIWGPGNASRAPVVPNLVHAAVRGEPLRQPVYARRRLRPVLRDRLCPRDRPRAMLTNPAPLDLQHRLRARHQSRAGP